MAKQFLSVAAIGGPPVVTQIVPRVSTSLATGLAPSRKRRAQSKLFAPYIVYPPPPPQGDQAILRLLLAYSRRGRPRSRLSPHHFVVYPTRPRLVARINLVAVPTRVVRIRRQSRWLLRKPVVVRVSQAGVTRIKLVAVVTRVAPIRRPPRSLLRKPVVVRVFYARPLMVRYVRTPRNATRTMAGVRAPIFVRVPAMGSVQVWLVQRRPPLTRSFLRRPVVVNP